MAHGLWGGTNARADDEELRKGKKIELRKPFLFNPLFPFGEGLPFLPPPSHFPSPPPPTLPGVMWRDPVRPVSARDDAKQLVNSSGLRKLQQK